MIEHNYKKGGKAFIGKEGNNYKNNVYPLA